MKYFNIIYVQSCKFLDFWICRSLKNLQNGENAGRQKSVLQKNMNIITKTKNIKISEIFKILKD